MDFALLWKEINACVHLEALLLANNSVCISMDREQGLSSAHHEEYFARLFGSVSRVRAKSSTYTDQRRRLSDGAVVGGRSVDCTARQRPYSLILDLLGMVAYMMWGRGVNGCA